VDVSKTLPPRESQKRRSEAMSTVRRQRRAREVEYPSRDGKPIAETQLHMDEMIDTIDVLRDHFAAEPNV
jgi:hypothetical protein